MRLPSLRFGFQSFSSFRLVGHQSKGASLPCYFICNYENERKRLNRHSNSDLCFHFQRRYLLNYPHIVSWIGSPLFKEHLSGYSNAGVATLIARIVNCLDTFNFWKVLLLPYTRCVCCVFKSIHKSLGISEGFSCQVYSRKIHKMDLDIRVQIPI